MNVKTMRDEDPAALDLLISRRMEEGWEWSIPNEGSADKIILLPPAGDERHQWCAEWIPTVVSPILKYADYFVPHWITEEKRR